MFRSNYFDETLQLDSPSTPLSNAEIQKTIYHKVFHKIKFSLAMGQKLDL
jgi:hypothetical protein